MKTTCIEVVLFDLGGVIIQFQPPGYFSRLLEQPDDASAMAKWLACPALQRYEKGEIDRQQFAAGIVEFFQLSAHPDDFLSGFLAWPQNLFPGSTELVTALQADLRVGCLSNTSEIHWENQKSSPQLQDMFKLTFLSFKLGLLKPDPAIYQAVTTQLECTPNAVMFFDDTHGNVKSAKEFGFDAHLVSSAAAARIILQQRGLLK